MLRTFAVYLKILPDGKQYLSEIIITEADNAPDVLMRWSERMSKRKSGEVKLLSTPEYNSPQPETASEVKAKIQFGGNQMNTTEVIINEIYYTLV